MRGLLVLLIVAGIFALAGAWPLVYISIVVFIVFRISGAGEPTEDDAEITKFQQFMAFGIKKELSPHYQIYKELRKQNRKWGGE